MSNPELSTILIIGLSGAGLKTFHLLIDKLYPTCGNLIKTRSIRIIAIEKSTFAYWPPGSLRASVEPEFENQIFSNFDHIIPKRIINDPVAKDLVKVITGVEVLELDLDQKQAKVNQSLEPHGIHTGVILSFDYLVMATVSVCFYLQSSVEVCLNLFDSLSLSLQGSSYAFPCRPPTEGQDPDQAKSELKALQTDIESSKSILIAGSGAVGLEFAGEVSYRYASPSTRKQIIIVSSTPAILMDHSKALAKSIESQLVARGVEMIYNYKVDLTSAGIHKTSKLDSLTSINLISNEDQSIKPIEGMSSHLPSLGLFFGDHVWLGLSGQIGQSTSLKVLFWSLH